MDIETLFTEQKWNILNLLSQENLSPLQISLKSNTTMANISQQLRLLEASSLVAKTKMPNRDKGKPRTVFHLTKDIGYLINIRNGFAGKKLFDLDQHHKSIMSIWFINDINLHYYLEKWLWKIESYLPSISAILFKQSAVSDQKINILIISNKPELKKRMGTIEIEKPSSQSFKVNCDFLDCTSFKASLSSAKGDFADMSDYLVLYDSNNIVSNELRNKKTI